MGGIFSSDTSSSSPGPTGPTGPKGETILNLNQVLADPALTKKLLDVFVTDARFKGVTGPAGIQGERGPTGAQGLQGLQGLQGPTGAQGLQGAQGAQGAEGPTGPRGEFSQIIGSNIDDTALDIFKNALVNDTQKRFIGPTGATGAQGPTGTITNMNDLIDKLKTNTDGTNWITTLSNGAFASTTALNNLEGKFNNLNTNIETNYIQKATANSDWWLKQLSGTYVNYVNETDPVKMSAYVWNNFYKKNDVYTKAESDGRYAKPSDLTPFIKKDINDLTNYYNTTQSDGRYAKPSDLTTFAKVSSDVTFKNINASGFNTTGNITGDSIILNGDNSVLKFDKNNTTIAKDSIIFNGFATNESLVTAPSSFSVRYSIPKGKKFGIITDNKSDANNYPEFSITSIGTNGDFAIQAARHGTDAGPRNIYMNNQWGGNVIIGKGDNTSGARLEVGGKDKLSINTDGKINTPELNIGSWSIYQDSIGCLIFKTNSNAINKFCPNGTQSSIVPLGTVVAWSGDVTKIPEGWIICDGNNGQSMNNIKIPDLRGRFILGINNDNITSGTNSDGSPISISKNTLYNTGGEEKHTLNINEMPNHSHYWCGGGGGGGADGNGPAHWDGDMHSNCAYQRINVQPAGNNQPHNNMPPYYVLAYIIKVY